MAQEEGTPTPLEHVVSAQLAQLLEPMKRCFETAILKQVDSLNDAVRALQLTVDSMRQLTSFNGDRDAQQLDSFLYQMERYFDSLNINDDPSKVRTASLYLTDKASLWWRRKQHQIQRGECRIYNWEDFTKELKQHFCPKSYEYVDWKKLKHRGFIHDYVNEFMTVMLRVPHMSDDELLTYFVEGLQDWVKKDVKEQCVKMSLYDVIAFVESLSVFDMPLERPIE